MPSAPYELTLPAPVARFVLAACDPFFAPSDALGALAVLGRGGRLVLEATDTFRVHRASTGAAVPPRRLLVPAELVAAALAADVDEVLLRSQGGRVELVSPAGSASSAMPDEEFPDLVGLDRPGPSLTVNLGDLRDALTDWDGDALRLLPVSEGVELAGEGSGLVVAGHWDAADLPAPLSVGGRFLLDALPAAAPAELPLSVTFGDGALSLGFSEGDWDFQAVIAPRRV